MVEKIEAASSEPENKSREDLWEAVQQLRESYTVDTDQEVSKVNDDKYNGTSVGESKEDHTYMDSANSTPPSGNYSAGNLTPVEEKLVDEQYAILKDYLTPEDLKVVVDADMDGVPDDIDQKIETRAETAKKFLEKLIEFRRRCANRNLNAGKMFQAILSKSSLLDDGQIANLLGKTTSKGAGDVLEDAKLIPGVSGSSMDGC